MDVKTLEDLQALVLEKYNVDLRFVEDVKQDIKAINKGHRQTVLLELSKAPYSSLTELLNHYMGTYMVLQGLNQSH